MVGMPHRSRTMAKSNNLSTTARALLTAAAARDDRVALPPERLPAAARRAVMQSLLKAGLVEEIAAEDDQPAWRTAESGERFALRITHAGRGEVGVVAAESANNGPQQPETAAAAPPAPATATAAQDAPLAAQRADARLTLRAAAQAVVEAWDEEGRPALTDAMTALRAALTTAVGPRTGRTPRADTKQATVLALLRRPEGASGPAMVEATGWAPHTVRGFLAGLAKKGITVTVLDRVRQVGSGKEGAKGSYTVYRTAEAG